jgi:hypothetical protein
LYNNGYDDTYFVTRFVAGLKEEIHSVIALHRPRDVDIASALALLQEEELARGKNGINGYSKSSFKQEANELKVSEADKSKGDGQVKEFEDKLASLRDYRCKNGLCFKCGGKWDKNHKWPCPAQVPIHVIEELLDALEETDQDNSNEEEEELEDAVMAVGHSDTSVLAKRRTLKLHGRVGKIEILILVDSRSVGTFISEALAQRL